MDPLRYMSADALDMLWAVYEMSDQRERARRVLDEIDRRQDADVDEWTRQMAPQL